MVPESAVYLICTLLYRVNRPNTQFSCALLTITLCKVERFRNVSLAFVGVAMLKKGLDFYNLIRFIASGVQLIVIVA